MSCRTNSPKPHMITAHQCKRKRQVFYLPILDTLKEPAKTCPVRQYSGDEVGLQYDYSIAFKKALDRPTSIETPAESPKDPGQHLARVTEAA